MSVEWVFHGSIGRTCHSAIIAQRAALDRAAAGEAIRSWDADAVSRGAMCCVRVLSLRLEC
jgi:hypothetical protein